MRLTVLGGMGAWPTAEQACSGYLLEHDGFRLLVDPGYATFPALQRLTHAHVDAVLVSHGHPDHCADLNPLLRARALVDDPPPRLPVYALPGALDAVLALDRHGMLADAYELHSITAGSPLRVGPCRVDSWLLPHFVPNVGLRVAVGDAVLAYTGDTGPSPAIEQLAREASLLLCEATHVDEVPPDDAAHLTSARQAGQYALAAGVARLALTHLWPGSDPDAARQAAAAAYPGPILVAEPGLVVDLP